MASEVQVQTLVAIVVMMLCVAVARAALVPDRNQDYSTEKPTNAEDRTTRHWHHRNRALVARPDQEKVEIYGMLVTSDNYRVQYLASGMAQVHEKKAVQVQLFGEFGRITESVFISFTKESSEAAGACNERHSLPYVPATMESSSSGHQLSAVIKIPGHSEISQGHVCLRIGNLTVFGGAEDTKTITVDQKLWFPLWVQIILIALLLMLSGLFSGLNLGLMALNKTDLKIIINTGTLQERKWASMIAPVRNHGNHLLCCLLLSNVLVNSTLTILVDNLMPGLLAIVLSTLFIVTFGEIVPQAICSRHGLRVGAKTISITKFFMLVTFPLAFPMSKILDRILGEEIGSVYTRERLKELLRVTKDHHGLENEEVGIISGALEMKTKTVKDVMKQLDFVFMLPSDAILNFETLTEIKSHGYSRIPVYERSRSNIAALLTVKQLLLLDASANIPLKSVIEFYKNQVFYVFENTRLDYMLRVFSEGTKGHMAFVQRVNDDGPGDPYYETTGIITMEDVLEALLQSDIKDESDCERTHSRTEEKLGSTPFKRKHPTFSRVEVPPTLVLAAVQFLSASVVPFKREYLTVEVLKRLVSNHVKFVKGPKIPRSGQSPQLTYLYEKGKPSQFFCMILEGRVQVLVGNEAMTFEGGPFTCFGTEFLTKDQEQRVNTETSEESTSSSENSPLKKFPTAEFIPDYTVKVMTDTHYFSVTYPTYLQAKRASVMDRAISDGESDENEAELEKVLSELDMQ